MPFHLLKRNRPTNIDIPPEVAKRPTLSFLMIRLLLLCWVLPVMLLILLGGSVLRQSLIEQSIESLTLSVHGASQLTALRMDSAVEASRNASYIGTIKSAWNTYQSDENQVALFQSSRTFLEQQYQNNALFRSTILLFSAFPEEPIYVINGTVGGTDRVRNDAAELFATATEMSENLDTGICFFRVGERVFMLRNLVDSSYQTTALLLMELNTDLLFSEFAQIPHVQQSVAYLNGVMAQAAFPETSELHVDIHPLHTVGQNVMTVEYEEGTMHAQVQLQGDRYTFAYCAVTSPDILQEQWNIVLLLLFFIVMLMLPLGALVYRFFARRVHRPIWMLLRMAAKIRREEYGTQLPIDNIKSREFALLGTDFNEMSNTLQQQFEHIYKEELALRDARMMALQSQINPHFLNNTLEIINWEARMQGNLKVCNMIESLSTMLGAAMDRNSNRDVSLAKELMYVDAYLYIINERLGKRLVFERDIPDAFLDVPVPRLVLQPLLENAVEHGITPVQQGRIALRARQEGDWLVLSVENDGALSPENLARIETLLAAAETGERVPSGSLGLRNVHQRLRIMYGEESGLLVDTAKKDKTVFKLKVKLA